MASPKSVFREGTRVVNCYVLSENYGKKGTIRNSLFKSRVDGWTRIFAWIKYDDGTEYSEMKKYLIREDEVVRLVCPKCKRETGMKIREGHEGNTPETNFRCTSCQYDWWIPNYLLKRMKVMEDDK
jgi:DNA-directed RNA polymerase subunit M/transcription elongation factor TFIIS